MALVFMLALGATLRAQGPPPLPPIQRLPSIEQVDYTAPAFPSSPGQPIPTQDLPPAAPGSSAAGAEVLPPEAKPAESIVIEEHEPEMQWYQPRRWMGPIWEGGVELGLNGSEGNSQTYTLKAGMNLKRKTDHNSVALDLSHARSTSDGDATQNNALGKLRYDHFLGESRWSIFFNNSAEYDEFKDFDVRLASNAGLGFSWIKNDCTLLTTRLGSGVSYEIGGEDEEVVPEAVFGLDFEHKISDKQKLCAKADYLPEWADWENYRVTLDVSWEVLLDQATNLSLKVGLIDRFDSTPGVGLEENDLDYCAMLLWKL